MANRRKRGNGGVSLRKDGRWEGRMVIGYDDKGLPVTKNVLAKTKSECITKLKALADSTKTPAPDQPKPGILLGDWLDIWYQSYKKANLRPNTQMSYERRIYQHIIPALGNIQMDKLTPPTISSNSMPDSNKAAGSSGQSSMAKDSPIRPFGASTPRSTLPWIKLSQRSSFSVTLLMAAMNFSCWNSPPVYAGVRSAPSSGMT